MANAKKCDACGVYYDFSKKKRSFTIRHQAKGNTKPLDICDSCYEKIEKILMGESETPEEHEKVSKHRVSSETTKYVKERNKIVAIIAVHDEGVDLKKAYDIHKKHQGGLISYSTFKDRINQYEEEGYIYSVRKKGGYNGGETKILYYEGGLGCEPEELPKKETYEVKSEEDKIYEEEVYKAVQYNEGAIITKIGKYLRDKGYNFNQQNIRSALDNLIQSKKVKTVLGKGTRKHVYLYDTIVPEKNTTKKKKPDLSTPAIKKSLEKETNTSLNNKKDDNDHYKLPEMYDDWEEIMPTTNPFAATSNRMKARNKYLIRTILELKNAGYTPRQAGKQARQNWDLIPEEEKKELQAQEERK